MSNEGHVTGEQLGTLPLIEAVYVDTVSGNFLSWVKGFRGFPRPSSYVLGTYLEMCHNSLLPHTFFFPMPPHVLSDFVVSTPAVAEV